MKLPLPLILIFIFIVFAFSSCKVFMTKPSKFVHAKKVSHSIFHISDSIPKILMNNEPLYFELTDINPYLYSAKLREVQREFISDIELSSKDFEINSVNNLKLYNLDLGEIELPIFQGSRTPDVKKLDEADRKLRQKISELEANKLDQNLNQLKMSTLNSKLSMTERDSCNVKNDLENEINDLEKQLAKQNESAIELIKEIEGLQLEITNAKGTAAYDRILNEKFLEYSKNYIELTGVLNKLVDFYNDLLLLVHSNLSYKQIKAKEEDMRRAYGYDSGSVLKSTNTIISLLRKQYHELVEVYNDISDKKKVDPLFQAITKHRTALNVGDIIRLSHEIAKLNSSITEENWKITYQTSSFSPRTDHVSYIIDIIPKSNQFTTLNRPIRFDYNFDLVGGVKIDVSAGLLFHLNLADENYVLQKLTDTTTLIIKEGQPNVYPTVGALLNIYKRSYRKFKPALNIGTGTDIQNVFYYCGISGILGSNERVGVGIGLAAGSVNRLSKSYDIYPKEENGNYILDTPIQNLQPEVMMSRVFKVGYYFTITYNLTGSNKETLERGLRK